jgi:hypothetical protein
VKWISRAWRSGALVATLVFGAAACGNAVPAGSVGTATDPPGVGADSQGWLAAIAVAEDPNRLDDLTAELLPIGGVSFVVSPVECFESLPGSHADVGYVLGFLDEDRAVVDSLVERSGRSALFVARVRSRCTD